MNYYNYHIKIECYQKKFIKYNSRKNFPYNLTYKSNYILTSYIPYLPLIPIDITPPLSKLLFNIFQNPSLVLQGVYNPQLMPYYKKYS